MPNPRFLMDTCARSHDSWVVGTWVVAGDWRRTSWAMSFSTPSSFSNCLLEQKSGRPNAAPSSAKQLSCRTVCSSGLPEGGQREAGAQQERPC